MVFLETPSIVAIAEASSISACSGDAVVSSVVLFRFLFTKWFIVATSGGLRGWVRFTIGAVLSWGRTQNLPVESRPVEGSRGSAIAVTVIIPHSGPSGRLILFHGLSCDGRDSGNGTITIHCLWSGRVRGPDRPSPLRITNFPFSIILFTWGWSVDQPGPSACAQADADIRTGPSVFAPRTRLPDIGTHSPQVFSKL